MSGRLVTSKLYAVAYKLSGSWGCFRRAHYRKGTSDDIGMHEKWNSGM